MVTIGIIATLMAILLPNLMGARERAEDAQKIQDLGAIKNGLRLYYNDHQAYPTGSDAPLGPTFSGYVSNVGVTAYKYYMTDNGDGFIICSNLAAGAGNDDLNSQVKCGVATAGVSVCGLGIGKTGDKVYTVCAK